jgi:hypothetical protein
VRPWYLLIDMMTNANERSGAEAASVNGGPDVAEIEPGLMYTKRIRLA